MTHVDSVTCTSPSSSTPAAVSSASSARSSITRSASLTPSERGSIATSSSDSSDLSGSGVGGKGSGMVGLDSGRSARAEGLAQHLDRLLDGRGGGGGAAQGVEHHEVVADAIEPYARGADTRGGELASVGLALVAQDVVLVDDHERFGQVGE